MFFSNAALTVRFITKRFIGDYDPTLGKQVFIIIIYYFINNIIICVTVGLRDSIALGAVQRVVTALLNIGLVIWKQFGLGVVFWGERLSAHRAKRAK